jgi:DNA repair protein RadC
MNETRLQMEERHVREGAERIANQKVLIAFLKRGRHEAALTTAEALLTQHEYFQEIAVENLEIERRKSSDSN